MEPIFGFYKNNFIKTLTLILLLKLLTEVVLFELHRIVPVIFHSCFRILGIKSKMDYNYTYDYNDT